MPTSTVSNPAVHRHQQSPTPPHRRFAAAAFALGAAVGYGLGHTRTQALRRQLAWQRHAARHDPLTGLPNRAVVYDLLDHTNPGLVGLCDLDDPAG
jgi:GGDEF domain-containing protein